MKKDKQSKQAAIRTASWLPGGAHRIAHEKRLQDKKTMDHRPSQPAEKVVGHQKGDAIVNAVLMYRAAAVLMMSAANVHRDHAARLIAAADSCLGGSA